MNLYTQGIDPKLDFSELTKIRGIYEKVTHMTVHDRHPYAGDLVLHFLGHTKMQSEGHGPA